MRQVVIIVAVAFTALPQMGCGPQVNDTPSVSESGGVFQNNVGLDGTSPFLPFDGEVARARVSLNCSDTEIMPGGTGYGALYGCIKGNAQTAKLFINETPSVSNVVQDVKLMWNRWTRDTGFGVDADEQVAIEMLDDLLELYAIPNADIVKQTFRDRTLEERPFESDNFIVTVRKSEGPAINEHLLTIVAR
jgi:hypothetical protein